MPVAPVGTTSAGLLIVPCGLCGSQNTRHRYRKFDLDIVECASCHFVYANPRLPLEKIEERYSKEYFWNEYLPSVGVVNGQVDLNFIDARYAPWIQLLQRELGPTPGRLLEIGSGAGLFLKAAARAGWTVLGAELNAEGAKFAQERLGLDIRADFVERLGLADGSFDAVVMFDVIEHLPDPLEVVQLARRLVRPGGVMIVQTPNLDAFSRHVLGSPWAVLSPAEHLCYFTAATLERTMTMAGFSRVTFEWNFPAFGPAETMNARYTHAPAAWRAALYLNAVRLMGPSLLRWVQRQQLNDQLIAVARV